MIDDGCPRCGSLISVVPNLKLYYSTCCGSILCRDCVSDSFKKKRTLACSECQHVLHVKDFKTTPFGKQILDKGRQSRTKYDAILNATEDDFEDQRSWYDHLEFVEEIIYKTVHGDSQDAQEAEAMLNEYKSKNIHLFKRNVANKVSFKAHGKDDAEMDVDEDVSSSARPVLQSAPLVYSIPLPEMTSEIAPKSPIRDPASMTPTTRKHYIRRSKVKAKMSKIAGGYSNVYDKLRIEQETFGSLFIFDQ